MQLINEHLGKSTIYFIKLNFDHNVSFTEIVSGILRYGLISNKNYLSGLLFVVETS